MKSQILCTTIAALAVVTLNASAQEGERPQRQLPPGALERLDTDGDGKVSAEERKAGAEARRAAMAEQRKKRMEQFDTNGDGKLDEAEREAMREAMKARHEALLAKYDADKDGRLSPEERKAAVAAGEELPRRPGAREGREGRRGPEGERGPRGPRGEAGAE